MKTADLLELAARNIRESRLRNALTVMGIAVGVASLVSMLSLGVGLQRLASSGIQRSGLFDTLTVTPVGGGGRGPDGPPPAADVRPLDEAARQELAKLPEAKEVYPNLNFSAEWRQGDRRPRTASASATPVSAKETDAFAKIQGRFFSSEQAPEVLLQKGFAAELAGASNDAPSLTARALAKQLVGTKLVFNYPARRIIAGGGLNITNRSETVEVVGILDTEAAGGRGRGPEPAVRLFVPLGFAENLHVMQASDLRDGGLAGRGGPVYQSLVLRLKSPSQAAVAEAAVKKMGFNTFSAIDATGTLRQVFAVVDLFLGAFGSLALAVASIGIVNTLVMAILERRREIGIMKALGASDMDIRRIFLAEAAVLGIGGGTLGIAIGWSIGRIINFGANIFIERQGLQSQQIWFVPWWLVCGALAFSLIASLLSGAYPAARAARLEPLDALRYE